MASDRAQGALIAASLAYALAVSTPSEADTQRALLDTASAYRRQTLSDDGLPRCEFCGDEVRPHTVGSYRKADGWAEVRRQGGTHSLVAQRFTGDVACAGCMSALRVGIAPDQQGSLLP